MINFISCYIITEHPYKAVLYDEEGKRYYFKEEDDYGAFRELLAQEISSLLGLDHIIYTPYTINGIKGVYSRDFMREKYEYFSGREILNDYIKKTKRENLDYLYNNNDYYGKNRIKESQDLYITWQAMENRFKNYPDYEQQIKKFMDDLINMIMFDLLIVTNDRHGNNWFIEYNETSFRLCPIFDNDYSFNSLLYSNFNTTQDLIYNNVALKILLNESDQSVYEKFVNFSSIVNPNTITTIINDTVKKYGFAISDEIKDEIISNFKKNYDKLETVLNSYKKEDSNSPTTK